jgi:hypothetical protein
MSQSKQLLQSKTVSGKVGIKPTRKSDGRAKKSESQSISAVSSQEQNDSFLCMTCGAALGSEMEWEDHNILVHRPS